jgi:sporulation integral membrane protein YlbJ
VIAILSFAFIILFAIYSEACIPAVGYTIKQFLFITLPSLLPFYVISNILIKSGFAEKMGKKFNFLMKPVFGVSGNGIFAVIIGMISGYPGGAKVIADMYEEDKISLHDAQVLSSYTNNTGPLFMIGVVGAGLLKNVKYGIFLFLVHIISSLIIGMIIGNIKRKDLACGIIGFKSNVPPKISRTQFFRILSESITNATYTMLPIAGTIIFFSSIIAVFNSTGIFPFIVSLGKPFSLHEHLKGLVPGFFEITTGINVMSLSNVQLNTKLTLISLMTGFAGISVHTQVIGILSKAKISCRLYLTGKVLQSLLAAILTFILLQFITF